MKDTTQSRVASVLTFGVGVWLMVSPLFLAVNGAALTNVLVVGGLMAAASIVQLLWGNSLPSWINAVAAMWLLGSAFIFSATTGFIWSSVLSGVAVFVLAVWDGIEVNHIRHTAHHTTA